NNKILFSYSSTTRNKCSLFPARLNFALDQPRIKISSISPSNIYTRELAFARSRSGRSVSPSRELYSRIKNFNSAGLGFQISLSRRVWKMHAKAAQSSFRDRTQEFQSVAERLKKSFSSGPGSGQNGPSSGSKSKFEEQRSVVAVQSEFNKRASKIGYGIHQTSQKLGKLTKCELLMIVAKRTSVFDDPTREIQELTAVIKQDITALNSAVVDLQLLSNSRNDSGNISSDTTSHSTTVVDDLKNRLMSTQKSLKKSSPCGLRQLFSASASKDAANPFVRQRPLAARSAASSSSASPPPWANGSPSSSQLFPKKQTDGESQPLLQQQQQQQQQEMVPLQDSYMQSRAEALQNVESTIHELSNIFNQLATLVSQQGEIAIRIDENMDDTLANVEGAQGALLKYLNSISSNRWLMIKIFFSTNKAVETNSSEL
ncbi:syntaxin of plants 32, partial [Prunus dulcis]